MQNLLKVLRKTDFVLLEEQYQTINNLAVGSGLLSQRGNLEPLEDAIDGFGNFIYSLMVAAGKDGLPVPEWVNPPKNQ